jgi:exo-1,4-beta-D-glucosaminidase
VMKTGWGFAFLAIVTLPAAVAQKNSTPPHDGWRLQSACNLHAGGEAISAPGFAVEDWQTVHVPSTVLAAQVANKLVPDPFFGMNLRSIPGTTYPMGQNFSNLPMPKDSPYNCGWWYRTEFAVTSSRERDKRTWIYFGGINYRGEVWVNGRKVADGTTIAGAYRTYDLDVTEYVKPGAQNVLAVETFAPTEKDLGINWVDWSPCPPDKDMGLQGEVILGSSGPVTLRSPMAVTHFQDESLKVADLTVYAELHNAADHAVKVVVTGSAAGVHFEQPVELAPREDKTVVFTPEKFEQLKIHNATPWWPAQMGTPHLEQLSMSVAIDGAKSDERSVNFGFREISSELTSNGSRLFRVNGKPILIRGAGWSQDMLLRTDKHRLEEQFQLVREMHLNTIRLEGKLETEDFFHLADEQGILVMLGWCCCDHWERWNTWTPEDLTIATASLRSQMLRLRYHASLLVWLNGSDNPPPANVEKAYLDVEAETHWPNPTLSSATGASTVNAGQTGVKMSGPYDYVAPSYWYVDKQNGGGFGFNTETSPGPAIPSLAGRAKFLADPEAWPPSDAWSFHNGGGEFKTLTVFNEAMAAVYAPPHSAAEYERMGQTMAYDSERAMYEAYTRNKYNSTGVIQWMLNNAWPSMIWHLYDYYLNADAGYFAVRKACEPLHIQYSYDDASIAVVNSTYQPVDGLQASLTVHGMHWNELYKEDVTLNSAADSVQRVFSIPDSLFVGPERLLFVDLTLKDATGHTVSRNFYWVPRTLTSFDFPHTDYTHTPAQRHEDLSALASLPQAKVEASVTVDKSEHGRVLHVRLNNSPQALAFQVRAAVTTENGGLIAPVYWSDNWIELAPGETSELTAQLPEEAPDTLSVQVEGWNIAPVKLTPEKTSTTSKGGR